MTSLSLAAIGKDRPGIVASVSRVLFDIGCNVEDSSMTLLRGNFAMMLVFTKPEGLEAADVEAALRPTCDEMGLTFSVRDVGDETQVPRPSHVLTVYGADRPGILFRTCEALAEAGTNITDLSSRLVGADEPVYALMLELEIPDTTDAGALDAQLREIAAEIGVDVEMHGYSSDIL